MDKFIIINKFEYLQDKLFYVDKKTKLTFRPGPTCLDLEIKFKTNYPVAKNSKFERKTYHQLTVASDQQDSISSLFNWSVCVKLDLAGTFHFICQSGATTIWDVYVIVKPEIKIPLGSIRCQTLLAKCLGPLSEWRKRLAITKEAGYNMIHLTPIQELGASNSAYSLRHQHKVNPLFKATLDDIKKEVDFIDKKWSVMTLTDIVLNHTANDSEWIREHPECSYNMANSKHLRPAFLLDAAFVWLAKDIMAGYLSQTDNLTSSIGSEDDVRTIGVLLKAFYVPQLKIFELFMVNIPETISKFGQLARGESMIIDHEEYKRNGSTVKMIPHWILNQEELRAELVKYNQSKKEEIKNYLNYAIDNALNAIRYERLNEHGCYYKQLITPEAPLVAPYFTHSPYDKFNIIGEESLMYAKGDLFMAHNGWVMGDSSCFTDFASQHSNVYLKRELIAWGDSVKLRYGSGPEDSPYLWSHMKKYVESQAKVFHGFRLDNCHSTPLNVAEFVVDVARAIRPDIYIMAELFTSSESTDNIFVNRLGITSLVRESMSAHNCQELGRLIYRFGGTPVGAFKQPDGIEPLKPQTAMAIFYDQTHDNDTPILKKSIYDLIPTTSILNMSNCATGSTRGYDELVPHHINVVSEKRLYASPDDITAKSPTEIGIVPLRKILNVDLLQKLKGFDEIFVDQINEDVIAITRHNPIDGRSILLVARTAFSKITKDCPMRAIEFEGLVSKTLFEAIGYGHLDDFKRNDKFINGLTTFAIKMFDGDTKLTEINNFIDRARITLNQFKFLPSSVVAFEICLSERQTKALNYLNSWTVPSLQDISLTDANFILFRCPEEDGWQPYEIPGFCKFTYSGLYGLMYYLQKVSENQDQAHPLAENLRQGNWLGQYIVARMMSRLSSIPIAEHLEEAFEQIEVLPRGMVPRYFHQIVSKLYMALVEHIYSNMSTFVREGPKLVKLLALSSVALIGECDSAPLPTLIESKPVSIAAGLPHFASGLMRNWGRDTFIAIRGLLLVTGRFVDARNIILAYGRTLKYGLIPNLLDGGVNSRYNCRDAVWWWLYSIREYTKFAPNGGDILKCKLRRIHKPERLANALPQRKRSTAQTNGYTCEDYYTQSLYDVIQESVECHFKGMRFVEERAGKQLDEHMKAEGFEVSFGVNRETGFVFGGNQWNCGTWMDKMGSSEKAGTKGQPASPRDGSAVEIIGLCKAVISWLDEAHKNRFYPYDGVECLYDNTITLKWTWKKWATLIQTNFEKYFYVPLMPNPTTDSELINRRGIYKDTNNASIKWQDFQLRPNFLVAMVVAPELFDKENARQALSMAKEYLCGPVGMKTLDPSDFNYKPDYINSDDSCDPKIANGFNYHQGPEWLWLTGFYIRASMKFLGPQEQAHHLQLFSNLYTKLEETSWLGLPELTNGDGKLCPDSCTNQAWSLGTTLEALYESIRNV